MIGIPICALCHIMKDTFDVVMMERHMKDTHTNSSMGERVMHVCIAL